MNQINGVVLKTLELIKEKPMTLFEIQKIENLNVNSAWYRINKIRKHFPEVKIVDWRIEFGRSVKVYGIGEKDVPFKSKDEIIEEQKKNQANIFERFRLWDAATRHAVMCRA